MVTEKPWKADAIIRLGLGVIVCVFAGSIATSLQHYFSAPTRANPVLVVSLSAMTFGALAVTLLLIRKPWPHETFMRRLMILVVCAYGGLFVGTWVQHLSGVESASTSIWNLALASLSFQGAALVLIAFFLREHRIGWGAAFGFADHPRRALISGMLIAIVLFFLGWGLQEASAFVITHLPGLKMEPQEQLPVRVLRVSMSWAGRSVFGVTAVVLAPLAEEMLFRGILYPGVKQAGYPRLALWGSALLFAAVHMNAVTFVPLAVMALVLTGLYEWTDNLLATITAHSLFNLFNLVLLIRQEQLSGI